jgi:hypothetical protein
VVRLGIPCFSGSCSEIYLEKAFDGNGLRPAERLAVARELGETSLMFLVHPTLTQEDMKAVADVVEKVMGRQPFDVAVSTMKQSSDQKIDFPQESWGNNTLLHRLLHPSNPKKILFFLLSDLLLLALSLYLAFLFHFDLNTNIQYVTLVIDALPWFAALKLFFFFLLRIYKIKIGRAHV